MPSTRTSEAHAGRVALVTGAARGIGQAIAVGLAKRGARIVLGDLGDMSETSTLVAGTGQPALPVRLDVSDPASIEAARSRVADGHSEPVRARRSHPSQLARAARSGRVTARPSELLPGAGAGKAGVPTRDPTDASAVVRAGGYRPGHRPDPRAGVTRAEGGLFMSTDKPVGATLITWDEAGQIGRANASGRAAVRRCSSPASARKTLPSHGRSRTPPSSVNGVTRA